MIPYFNQKIWYAFQGLPTERVNGVDYLPWSKCLVLTNNLMYILQYEQLMVEFKNQFEKKNTDDIVGVTYEEYIRFLDRYRRGPYRTPNSGEDKDRNSNPEFADPESPPEQDRRLRGNTLESRTSDIKTSTLKVLFKSESELSAATKTFDDYCWTLYKTKHLPGLSSQCLMYRGFFNLWRMFIAYSMKRDGSDVVDVPVRMDVMEVNYWSVRIKELLGVRRDFYETEIGEDASTVEYKDFYSVFQEIFKSACLTDSLSELAIRQLTEEALDGVTLKGPIRVDRCVRFCVLKSFVLMVYNSKVAADNFRNHIVIAKDAEIQTGNNKIQIKLPNQVPPTTVTIEVADIQQFNKWHTALSDAVGYSKSNILIPALEEARRREEIRQVKRSALHMKRIELEIKLEEERKERCKVTEAMEFQLRMADEKLLNFREQMAKELNAKETQLKENEDIRLETEAHIKLILNEQQTQYKIQLEKMKEIEDEKNSLNEILQATREEKSSEEMKRTQLEEKHLEAQQMLHEAEEKITTLEKLGEQLEKALEEEKQAKEEEEAVRNATLALLEEEQRSKENLQALLLLQNSMIDQEIQKRNEFAQELEDERCRIKDIADEKEKLAKQLEDTRQKMQSTGNRVRKLDTRVAQIADNVFGSEETRVPVSHRGRGFIAEVVAHAKIKKTSEAATTAVAARVSEDS